MLRHPEKNIEKQKFSSQEGQSNYTGTLFPPTQLCALPVVFSPSMGTQ